MKGTIILRLPDTSDGELSEIKQKIKEVLGGIEGWTLESMTSE
jgi:hypothetical protein